MSKSILVIDTPKTCAECQFISPDTFYCTLTRRIIDRRTRYYCPLKSMPEEREDESCHDYDCFLTRFTGGVGNKNCYGCGEANGWNDCIKEILEEEK